MVAKAGASLARKGSRLEARVVADQVRLGRLAYRLRQGQGCPVDVISIEHCQDGRCSVNGDRVAHVYLIQCKVNGYLPPTERAALLEAAQAVGAIPMLARPEGKAISYEPLEASL